MTSWWPLSGCSAPTDSTKPSRGPVVRRERLRVDAERDDGALDAVNPAQLARREARVRDHVAGGADLARVERLAAASYGSSPARMTRDRSESSRPNAGTGSFSARSGSGA